MCENCGCSELTGRGHAEGHHPGAEIAAALSRNARLAERNRAICQDRGVCFVNVVSFPRSDARALVERTAEACGRRRPAAVLTVADLERLAAFHGHAEHNHAEHGHGHAHAEPADGPAVDAHAVGHALPQVALGPGSLLLLENGGSAACQAVYDLGESLRAAVFSVCEGESKPLKFPLLFAQARAVVVNRISQAAAAGFDAQKARANIARVAPGAAVFELDPEGGAGMDAWCAFLEHWAQTNVH